MPHNTLTPPTRETANINQFIIQEIRKKVPQSKDITSILSEVLHLSKSAIYRKMSGEAPFSLHEAALLAKQFSISLDNFILGGSSATGFRFRALPEPEETDVNYYTKILEAIYFLHLDSSGYELHMATQEITPFHYMYYPELTAFQSLIWSRVTMRFKNVEDEEFRLEEKAQDPKLLQIAQQTRDIYMQIPGTEYISSTILDKNLDALKHFAHHPIFADRATPVLLCEQLVQLVNHLFEMAKMGRKFPPNQQGENTAHVPYTLFHDMLPNYDTNLLFKSPLNSFVFCSFDYPNFMYSYSPKMSNYVEKWLNHCRTHSNRISGESEMYRNQVKQMLLAKIAVVKKQLLNH